MKRTFAHAKACCWCGTLENRRGMITREHLAPRALRLPWRDGSGPRMLWACGPCNWSRGEQLGPPPAERSSFGPPPGGFQGFASTSWSDGMAWWISASIPVHPAAQRWVLLAYLGDRAIRSAIVSEPWEDK